MYDVAIIGTGPAGLAAALNFKLHNKNFIWFGSSEYSPKIEKSEKIANYPGVPMVSGKELNAVFKRQAAEQGIENCDKMVTAVMPMDDKFMLLADNEPFEAKTVLLCAGVANAKGIPGEEDFLGRGVSYCATCDGFLNNGKDIAVFSGGERYESDVAYLAELANKLYVFRTYKTDRQYPENVIRLDRPIKEIRGKRKVSSVLLSDGTEIDVGAFFALRNAIAPDKLIPGLELDGAHIKVDRSMATNIRGVFAAGDCTGRPYQITKAVGEGNVASLSIIDHLAES